MKYGAVLRTIGLAPMPSGEPTRLVAETPGCAAAEISFEPAASERRCSSRANSRLASLLLP